MELFERNNLVPSTKLVTFFKGETFSVQASYSEGNILSKSTEPVVGTYEIGPFPKAADGEKQKLKVKMRLNLNSLVSVESAQPEAEMKDAAAPTEGAADAAADAMETDAKEGE